MITRSDIAKRLEYGVRAGFLNGTRTYTPLRALFCQETPSTGAFEQYSDMGDVPWPNLAGGKAGASGTDDTGAPVTGSLTGQAPPTVLGAESRALVVNNLDWNVMVSVTHNAINDDRVGNLEAWARDAGRNFEKHKDFLAFDALNNGAATTSYGACYDGLSFFNDSHLDPGAQYATVQDNSNASALSLDNYETVRVAAAKFRDSRGQPVGLTHSLLIVPPDLERVASQIVTNKEDYGTGNRAMNPYAGSTRLLVAPGGWLDATAWFIVDPGQSQKPIYLQVRQEAELVVWDNEDAPDGGVRNFKWHARYVPFYGDWRLCSMGNT